MSYHATHRTGRSEAGLPFDRFEELLDELATADVEHPDVSITHESEWNLSVFRSGFVVLENLEEGEPVHLGPLDRARTLELMKALAEGRISDVQAAPWKPGYPPRTGE